MASGSSMMPLGATLLVDFTPAPEQHVPARVAAVSVASLLTRAPATVTSWQPANLAASASVPSLFSDCETTTVSDDSDILAEHPAVAACSAGHAAGYVGALDQSGNITLNPTASESTRSIGSRNIADGDGRPATYVGARYAGGLYSALPNDEEYAFGGDVLLLTDMAIPNHAAAYNDFWIAHRMELDELAKCSDKVVAGARLQMSAATAMWPNEDDALQRYRLGGPR
ncbi:hypothetical protein LTR53_006140 [Teratosphaeriaceae sp. CCFEE 6253]|nr:hypothetical protein LTR53_006140 [Teratosphaeriaceae sp. CCFEE 6253]